MPVSNEKLHHVDVKEKTERETAQGQSHRDERQGCTSIARIHHESCSWSHQLLVPKRRCSHDFWQGRTHTYKPIAGQPSRKVKQMRTSNRQPPTENKETVPPTVTWDQTWTESNDCAVTPSTWKGFKISARKSYAEKPAVQKLRYREDGQPVHVVQEPQVGLQKMLLVIMPSTHTRTNQPERWRETVWKKGKKRKHSEKMSERKKSKKRRKGRKARKVRNARNKRKGRKGEKEEGEEGKGDGRTWKT